MNIPILVAAALASAYQQPVFADVFTNSDAVSTSFVRMLEHRPDIGRTVSSRTTSERDPLEALVYTMLQGQRQAPVVVPDAYGAHIAASFDRMLDHQAHTDPVSRSAYWYELDPLEAAIRALVLAPRKETLASGR